MHAPLCGCQQESGSTGYSVQHMSGSAAAPQQLGARELISTTVRMNRLCKSVLAY